MILKFDAFAFRVELDISIVCQLFEIIGFSPCWLSEVWLQVLLRSGARGFKSWFNSIRRRFCTGVYVSVMGSHSGRVP